MATRNPPIVVRMDDPECWERGQAVCAAVRGAGGRALLVGGCVRDSALGLVATDLDIEVYGIPPARLVELLSGRFALDLVGRAFSVIKIRGVPIDVSIPRSSSRGSRGPDGFEALSDPDPTPAEAAGRRDFTINAIALDPLSGKVIDPFRGLEDLGARVLRHTSEKFAEDPLRVLRGMQIAARFELEVAEETVALCRRIEPGPLGVNRWVAERLFRKTYDLELEEANERRIWAYRRAAWTVDELAVSIADLYNNQGVEGLMTLSGIGERLGRLIADWLKEWSRGDASHD